MRTRGVRSPRGLDREPRFAWLPLAVVAIAGVLGSGLLFWSLRASETARIRADLEQVATERLSRVRRELGASMDPVHSTVALFDSSETVTHDEFRTFTLRELGRTPAVHAIVWMEAAPGGAEPRLEVRFAEGTEAAVISDAAEEVRRDLGRAMLEATREGVEEPVVVSPAPGGRAQVLVTVPVLTSSGRPQGAVVGLLDLDDLFQVARSIHEPELRLFVEDVSEESARVLAGDASRGERIRSGEVTLGGRRWILGCTLPTGLVGERRTWAPWLLLALGLVTTGLLLATVATITSRAHIHSIVERRTKEIKAAYDTLAAEAYERLQAVSETQLVERRLREIIDLVPDMIYVKDWHGRFLLANDATAEAFGTTVQALTAPGAVDMNTDATAPDETLREERLLIESELSSVIRAIPFIDASGKRRILRTVKIPCTAFGKRTRALLCVATDITEQKYSEDVLRSQNRILGKLAQGIDPDSVLADLVNMAEEIVPDMRCSVLVMAPDGRHLCQRSAPSLPRFYNEAIDGLEIGPHVGSCGAAAHRGERVVVNDVMTHENWEPYRDLAQSANIRACWSQPIMGADGEILGTFAMYYAEPRTPEPHEGRLMESMAHLAGIAIERGRLQSS